MIITILIWFYLGCLALIYGTGMLILLRRVVSHEAMESVPPMFLLLLGLATLAWLSSLVSLLMKVGLAGQLLILAGAVVLLYFQGANIREQLRSTSIRWRRSVWVLAALTFLMTLLYAVKPPDNPDTTLYHAQSIRWLEEYPAVPGLGNLEPRLGANSTWFSLNALFSFSFLGLQSFHLVPSFLFLVAILYFLSGLDRLLQGDLRISQLVKLGFVPMAVYVLVDELSSPGTDLPVILYYWATLCLWLESMEDSTSRHLQSAALLFSMLVVTFKMSGIVVLLIGLFMLIEMLKRREIMSFSRYALLAAVILLPWLVRNFILTGYWLYPEPAMRFLSPSVDWKIPVERVLSFKQGVQSWALFFRSPEDLASGGTSVEQLSFWFSKLTLNQKALILAAFASPVFFLIPFLLDRPKLKMYLPVFAVSYVSLVFWLFSAPNLRFGYGFVFGAILMAFMPFVALMLQRWERHASAVLLGLALILSLQQVHVMLGSRRDGTQYREYLILPADYIQVKTDACTLDGADIFCARRYRQCSYDAFPCVPQIPKNVELRGETFGDGFRAVSTQP